MVDGTLRGLPGVYAMSEDRDELNMNLLKELARLREARKVQKEAVDSIKTSSKPSGGQLLEGAILAALPTIVGQMSSGYNAPLLGAKLGSQASQGYFSGLADAQEEQALKKREEALDILSGLDKEIAGVNKGLVSNRGEQFKQADRQALRDAKAREAASNNGLPDLGVLERRDLSKEFTTNRKVLSSINEVVKKLSIFDTDETLGEAIKRGAQSGIFPDSQARDLKRLVRQYAVEQGKKNFPGAISDSEREFMLGLKGGEFGVPVGILREIMRRDAEIAIGDYRAKVDFLSGAVNIPESMRTLNVPDATARHIAGVRPLQHQRVKRNGRMFDVVKWSDGYVREARTDRVLGTWKPKER